MDKKTILIITIGLVAITFSINASAMMGGNRGGNNQGYHMNGSGSGYNGYRNDDHMNGYDTGYNSYTYENHMNGYNMNGNGDHMDNTDMDYDSYDHMNEGYNHRENGNQGRGSKGYYFRQEYKDEGY